MLPGWIQPASPPQLGAAAAVLWPDASVSEVETGATPRPRAYVALPSLRQPRLLLPAGHRHAAARAVQLFSGRHCVDTRLRAGLVSAALNYGGTGLLRGRLSVHAGIERMLTQILGQELVLAVHLGPPRANRKPVLALLTPDGRPAGFGKLGVNGLTDRLVRAETAALRQLASADLPDVTVPRVLHAGMWNGHPLLVQEPLPVCSQTEVPNRGQLLRCVTQIAGMSGVKHRPLANSPYLAGLCERLSGLADLPETEALRSALARLPAVSLAFGAWHGDLTRWNIASTPRRDFVWDWERLTEDVPVGFDALHFSLTEAVRGDARRGAMAWLRTGASLLNAPELARLGVCPEHTRVVMTLYLVELASRYLHDGQAQAGGRLGQLNTWLLPALSHLAGAAVPGPRPHDSVRALPD
ncbi:phosphotransferase [Lipingzhangella sp. LS1_29]|uniref:Phosphotransferase n=1 Tax=Lipingzhangella rawalii TaxID=2055835 RepID=A0ABU2H3C1_9ACTN|nr:phosphotransferase [Lipingzhangella rawalii]MDS1269802.1 phosphotransferase [Lipingzhangella rawalii]